MNELTPAGRAGPAPELPLTPEECLAFQAELWKLLEGQTARYTIGESTSVPVETAQELLESLCFTLRVDETDTARIRLLLQEKDLDQAYRRGFQLMDTKVRQGQLLWQAVCENLPDIENRSLHDTLRSIGTFWQRYDRRYFAHQIPCDIDYQLCRPVPESLRGVDYVMEYLRRLWLENGFLRRFDPRLAVRLLNRYCPGYRELLINLFEPVAVNALGLVLLGVDPRGLDITEGDRERLSLLLEPLPRSRAEILLLDASTRLCAALSMDGAARQYLGDLAKSLFPRIAAAMDAGALDGVFLSLAAGE